MTSRWRIVGHAPVGCAPGLTARAVTLRRRNRFALKPICSPEEKIIASKVSKAIKPERKVTIPEVLRGLYREMAETQLVLDTALTLALEWVSRWHKNQVVGLSVKK